MLQVVVISLFPEMFSALTESGISGRAVTNKLVQLQFINPRDFAADPHKQVDDRPYGGGPGMVLKAEPLAKAIAAAKELLPQARVIYLSPTGARLTQNKLNRLASTEQLILLCGRYEGIDQRIIDLYVDEQCSIGDYVISGGELAAMVVLDGIIRLLPGALGAVESAQQDSFVAGLLDCPHYTRPEVFAGQRVPEVLLSGDHAAIKQWRLQQAQTLTAAARPDLLD